MALNGDGGDESFAGYLRHAANQLRIAARPPAAAGCAAAPRRSAARCPPVETGGATCAYARRLLQSRCDEDPVERYAWHVSIFNAVERDDLLRPEFAQLVSPGRARAVISETLARDRREQPP